MSSESEPAPDDTESSHEDADSQNVDAEAPAGGEPRPDSIGAIDRLVSGALAHWLSLVLTASVIATVGLAACLFVLQYRPDRRPDDPAARQAIQAASDGAVAALSYSSANMEGDFARARSHLTGDF